MYLGGLLDKFVIYLTKYRQYETIFLKSYANLQSLHHFAMVRSVLALPSLLPFTRLAFSIKGSNAPPSWPDQGGGATSAKRHKWGEIGYRPNAVH